MKKERTFVIIKIDGIQRSLVGEVISRFERVGLKLVAMKMLVPTESMVEKHYTLDPNWFLTNGEKTLAGYIKKGITPPSNDPIELAKATLKRLGKYMSSGPVIAMVWEGAHAVGITRKLVGGTEPLTSDVGTIRGDFVLDSYQLADMGDRAVRNIVHASGSVQEAKDEINLWFKKEELINYNHIQDAILYDVDLSGILEEQ